MASSNVFSFDLFDSFPDLCFLITDEGRIIEANLVAVNLICEDKNQIINNKFFDFVPETEKLHVKVKFEAAKNNQDSEKFYTKLKFNKKIIDASLFFANFESNTTENSAKKYFVFVRDISEQMAKARELNIYYTVAENTVNPLQITNTEGKMIYMNKAFLQASGYSREELIGKNPNVFSSGKHSKRFWNKMWTTIKSGKVWVGEVENRRKNGDPFYAQLLISPIIDDTGNVTSFFGIHRDLGEKKILEKQLVHTQKMESIGTLAAGVAHEVGNPLASISALVQVIQRSTSDNFAKEKLDLVKSQVTRISKIIRDLVDFSRPSNYELQLTDINKNLEEAIEIIKVGAKAKNITFKKDLHKNLPLLALVADQIQQVFVNILLNAVDVIIERPRMNGDTISVDTDLEEDNIVVTFTDSGKGIPEENYAKVFEPFFTTKKEGKGTGLGLWVSYGIIKSFQGDIKVSSKLGEGTTFIITLPIHT